MKLIYSREATLEFQFTCEPHTESRKAAIDAIRNGPSIADLVAFAEDRHGYQNTDGFFGITYPGDLDDFEKANGRSIPDGFVEANAWYGESSGERLCLPESEYLELLRQFLALKHQKDLANRIESLLRKDT